MGRVPGLHRLPGRRGLQGRRVPRHQQSSEKAAKAFTAKGIDVSAFTTHVKDGTTFLFPIADKAAKVDGIMKPAMDAVLSGKKPASSLTEANNQVNALFK